MSKQTITVVGGTGAQGGGVVDALLASGQYAVRVALGEGIAKSRGGAQHSGSYLMNTPTTAANLETKAPRPSPPIYSMSGAVLAPARGDSAGGAALERGEMRL